MANLTWIHLFVLIFAAFRLTHLVVYDKITAFLRKPFIETTMDYDENGNAQEIAKIKGTGFRHWMGTLLSCHWCTGVWCAILVVLVDLYAPVAFPLLVILAVAGAAAVMETLIP